MNDEVKKDEYKKEFKKLDKIDVKLELFYRALGQFNTNVVGWLLSSPDSIDEITEFLDKLACPREADRCRDFGPDFEWSELRQACVRKPRPGDFE